MTLRNLLLLCQKVEAFSRPLQKNKKSRAVALTESGFLSLRDGGEEEIRTLDPHVANVMLYQLSYFPMSRKRRILYHILHPHCKGVF